MRGGSTYLPAGGAVTNPFDLAPELSRRARGFALWAALRGRLAWAPRVDEKPSGRIDTEIGLI